MKERRPLEETHAAGERPRIADVSAAALQEILAPVSIIGVASGGRMAGLCASWLTRVSLMPPLLVVSIAHGRHTYTLLRQADRFSVSTLRDDQVEMARHFGLQSGRDVDKWAAVDHVLLAGETPALAHCAARFLCRIVDRFPTGDHDCFVGEMIMAEVVSGGPLLPYRREDYHAS
jgi:flavin reductase (DIM6/NTAB) family NADH-FMN oxidoreductase RutF